MKVSLGTRWGFEKMPKPFVIYAIDLQGHLLGHDLGLRALRVAPHPTQPGWTADCLPLFGPWEPFVDGPFHTPQQTARAMTEEAERREETRKRPQRFG